MKSKESSKPGWIHVLIQESSNYAVGVLSPKVKIGRCVAEQCRWWHARHKVKEQKQIPFSFAKALLSESKFGTNLKFSVRGVSRQPEWVLYSCHWWVDNHCIQRDSFQMAHPRLNNRSHLKLNNSPGSKWGRRIMIYTARIPSTIGHSPG
jgi:hypothetical protein